MEKSEKIEVIRNSKSSRRTISFDEDFEEIKAGENDRNLRSRYREDRRKLACSWLPLSRFSLIDEVGFSFFLIGSSIFRSSNIFSTILTRIFFIIYLKIHEICNNKYLQSFWLRPKVLLENNQNRSNRHL